MDPAGFTFDDFAFPTTDAAPDFGVDGFQWASVTVRPGGFVAAAVTLTPRVVAAVTLTPRVAATVTLGGGAA